MMNSVKTEKTTLANLKLGDIVCRSLIGKNAVYHVAIITKIGDSVQCIQINDDYTKPKYLTLTAAGFNPDDLRILVADYDRDSAVLKAGKSCEEGQLWKYNFCTSDKYDYESFPRQTCIEGNCQTFINFCCGKQVIDEFQSMMKGF